MPQVRPTITGHQEDELDRDRLLEELVEKRRCLQGQIDAIPKIERISPTPGSNLLAKEIIRQLHFVKSEISHLGGVDRVVDSSPILRHWLVGEKLSFERVQFRMSQLRDRSNNEDRLRKALGQTDDMLASTVTEDQKWKNTERNWQLYMAESKKSLLEDDLAQYRYFVPDLLIKDVHYPSTPVSGKIRLQIFNIDFTDLKYKDDLESLVVQVIIDSKASEPIKFKRRIPCDLRTTGVSFDLNQAQSFELLVFDKLAKLKGFVFFRLSWMMEYMEGTFDKVFKEKMELVSRGTIELSIRNQTTSTLIEPLQNGIFRKKAIKRKIYKRLGHEFVSHGQGALILKCAHCSDLIYTATSAYCRKCRFTCHKDCSKAVYIRCIADPNYKEYEEMTNALLACGRPHTFENVSVKTPCFCGHCGHMIPIMGNPVDSLNCRECGIYFHAECETYAPDLCLLPKANALQICRKVERIEEPPQDLPGKLESPTILDWPEFNEHDFEYLSVIGKGNFGKVMLARCKADGHLFALKILKKSSIIENDEKESILAERSVFSLVRSENNPFLVSCHGIYQSDTRIFFVMEFIGGGDLMFHIQRRRFTEDQAKFFAAEVLLALEFLHKRNYIYRDLKLDNVLLTLDGHAKLADYGLCKSGMAPTNTTATFCGTPEFMAPEILQDKPYTRSVDWWAFGVFIFELLFSQAPFHGKSEGDIFRSIMSGRISFPVGATLEAKDLILKLLIRDPELRLGAGKNGVERIKKHPFFSKVDFVRLIARKVPSPFIPTLSCSTDVSNFDREFTQEVALLTPMPTIKLPSVHEEFFESLNRRAI